MLKKLLKYDLKYVFKYWWIAAVVCFSLSVVSGFCIRLLEYSSNVRELPMVVESSASSLSMFAFLSFVVIAVICIVLIFSRFYNNFFSDEGYLTFTLPVKRSQLINSKIITATIIQISTIVLIVTCILLMVVIGFWEKFWNIEIWRDIAKLLKLYFGTNTLCRILYIVEILLGLTLYSVFSNLFLFCCITLASIVTKKARVITSIGIYYGINCLISFATQIFAIFGIEALISYFSNLSDKMLEPVVCLAGFGFILFIGIFCGVLYALQYRMLDRKLNLA